MNSIIFSARERTFLFKVKQYLIEDFIIKCFVNANDDIEECLQGSFPGDSPEEIAVC